MRFQSIPIVIFKSSSLNFNNNPSCLLSSGPVPSWNSILLTLMDFYNEWTVSQSLDALCRVLSSSLCGTQQIKPASGEWLCITLTCIVSVWTDTACIQHRHRHWPNIWCACSTFNTRRIRYSIEECPPFWIPGCQASRKAASWVFFPYFHDMLHILSPIYLCPLGILTGCESTFLILSLRII